MADDRRLIEDYLPIQAISAEASREKSVRKGHISTLHLWWARRPLVACRAAVYGALVPIDRFRPKNGPLEKRDSLARANAKKFVERLCKYPGAPQAIAEAQQHILEAHAERLTAEFRAAKTGEAACPTWVDEFKFAGERVTVEDIVAGRAPRPRVLDMFAGGGSIPLEALRLGCEAYALDLNPVAHIIELCTLVYPQKYGKPDPTARGMTGPPSYDQAGRLIHQSTWGGLANEVRYWGEWVLRKVKAEIGDLYPLIPDPDYQQQVSGTGGSGTGGSGTGGSGTGGSGTGGSGTGGPPVISIQQELQITRRTLPHWEMGGSTYFITYHCAASVTLNDAARTLVLDNWKHWHGKRYLLHAAVVMPDHVHVLITPKAKGQNVWYPLEDILHTNKSYTAHEINKAQGRKGSIWQDERFDRIVRDENEFFEKWNYMANNPVKNGLADRPKAYPWLHQDPDAYHQDSDTGGSGTGGSGTGGSGTGGSGTGGSGTGGSPVAKETGQRPVPPDSSLDQIPPGYLMPVAYLWTRTVTCKKPNCRAIVPLVRQTWLCKKPGRYVALKMVASSTGGSPVNPQISGTGGSGTGGSGTGGSPVTSKETGQRPVPPLGKKKVRFEVVEAHSEKDLGFDPAGFSKRGNATCPFCGTVADSDYLKAEGCAGRMGRQMLALVGVRPGQRGKAYLSADDIASVIPDDSALQRRIASLCKQAGLTVPNEEIEINPRSMDVDRWGLRKWSDLFIGRQMLCLLTATQAVRSCAEQMKKNGHEQDTVRSVASCLAFVVDRLADWNSSLCSWSPESTGGAKIGHTFGRQSLPMLLDFCESGVWGEATGSLELCLDWVIAGLTEAVVGDRPAVVSRGSATSLSYEDQTVDAVITDPPYYDNVSYSNLSDFFYVWLKRSIGHHYSEHFAGEATPKRKEAIAAFYRHGGDKEKSKLAYETMMAEAFRKAYRVLKPDGPMAVVYAHKTTLGWATLVDAMRQTGFIVTEAWPLDTEMKARMIAMDTAALASSIFLVARKREGAETGNYEDAVKPELEQIVRERVETLWAMGISGADLKIAAVGAGLRAFTRFAKVEYANGEEVPAERFLAEVEGVVQEMLLEKIFVGQAGGTGGSGTGGSGTGGSPVSSFTGRRPVALGVVDGPTRFYVLWRYMYGAAELDAGEAIVFTYGQPVELDGPRGLSGGARPLVEKKKGKYRLRDFTERGEHEKLGLPEEAGGPPAPLVDVLHRTLWLMENRPRRLADFLLEAQPNHERLHLIAEGLAGKALSGGEKSAQLVATTTPEQAALQKLTANWRSLITASLFDSGSRK